MFPFRFPKFPDTDFRHATPSVVNTGQVCYNIDEGKLYFHCARTGHKLDAIQNHSKVSFCVIDQDLVIPEAYTTHYRSVIAFGKAHILTEEREIRTAIERLAMKYAPEDNAENRAQAIDREMAGLCMFVLDIEHMTGKEAIELVREKN